MSSEYVLGTPSLYAAGELQVRLDVDEANDSTLTFTDKEERTVLVRLRSGGVSHDTYYAYNDYGLLCCVLPPAAEGRTDAASLARYAYRYCYDSRDRCIEKQLPGCDPVRYVYDRADRLVLEQDGVQRAGNRWTVHKYDGQGRLLYSYEHTDATPLATLRETLKSRCVTERYTGTGGLGIGYTHTSLAGGSDLRLLVVNYYDDYRFLNLLDASTRSSLVYAALSGYDARHPSACGQLTGTRSYVADAGGQYIVSAIYYDAKGRPVQQHTTTLRGGYERSWLQYRFAGGVQRLRRHHYDPSGGNLVSSYRYAYDSCERLTAVYHTLGNGQEVCLSTLSYDAYGRLGRRTLHGGIHSSTYSYNIRDWLTGISGPKFTQNLYYNTGSGTPCWNGNISSMTWQAGSETTLRGYKFAYDGLNRLTSATYGEGTSLTASPNRFTEKVTSYDKNGNILALQRYGQTAASTYGLIDNLMLTYDGNCLTRADDVVTASAYGGGFEFKDAVKQANEYTYDANGNLTKDLNKNISSIQYNCLNLPSVVTFSDGSTITYTYAADGTKLRTVHQIGGTTTTTDYCDDVIYENGVQKLLLTEAGYITLADNQYHYYLQDHQGNNRVVLNQSGAVEEVNHYYPFGGVFASTSSVQPYKYNGKEYDNKKGLNWYDYGARHYDAALGRFLTVDPLAENMHSANQYTYCLNNPLRYIDVMGLDTISATNLTPEVWREQFDPQNDVVAIDEVTILGGNSQQSMLMTALGMGVGYSGAAASTISGNRYTERFWGGGYFKTSRGTSYPLSVLEKQPNGKYVRGVQGLRIGMQTAKQATRVSRFFGNSLGFLGVALNINNLLYNSSVRNYTDLAFSIASIAYWEIGVAYTFGTAFYDWVIMPNARQMQENIENGVSPMFNVYNPQTGRYEY